MSERDGGPAFPSASVETVFVEELGRYDDRLGPPMGGMSIRDYFAAKALVIFSDAQTLSAIQAESKKRDLPVETLMAHSAYELADEMLKERGKSV